VTRHEYRYEEHSDEYMDNTSTGTRNIVTSAWTIPNQYSIHEQSECYTCKQYECNEYVRSALARSQYEYMDEEHSDEYMDDRETIRGTK
jgi:tRNA U34 5-methylaminomethyl-2-thiouridine-forming methyltransferase MnmC